MQKIEIALSFLSGALENLDNDTDNAMRKVILEPAIQELAEIKELLKSMEWGTEFRCPECGWAESKGHKPDCKLANFLAVSNSQ